VKKSAYGRTLNQVAGMEGERCASRGPFAFEYRGQVRNASDAIGIRKQTIMQIIEMQDGELVNGALPAAGE